MLARIIGIDVMELTDAADVRSANSGKASLVEVIMMEYVT
jgi:hypothetical protein